MISFVKVMSNAETSLYFFENQNPVIAPARRGRCVGLNGCRGGRIKMMSAAVAWIIPGFFRWVGRKDAFIEGERLTPRRIDKGKGAIS